MRRSEQVFNASAARSQATMLMLAAIALVLPAAYRSLLGEAGLAGLGTLSIAISILLLLVYGLFLFFSLVTHASWFAGTPPAEAGEETHARIWSTGRAAAVLAAATASIAWMSEILVGAIEPMTHSSGLNRVFVSVFVVAILGNAAEHATAITAAMKNRMDLSLSIAIGSSIQVALFVAPVLVLASLVLGPAPMDLAFPTGLVLIVFLSVLITAQVAGDGRSDWLKGLQLLSVYLVLAITFFFVPIAVTR
jgi:Ca2+:H+ antiporter